MAPDDTTHRKCRPASHAVAKDGRGGPTRRIGRPAPRATPWRWTASDANAEHDGTNRHWPPSSGDTASWYARMAPTTARNAIPGLGGSALEGDGEALRELSGHL